MRIFLITLAVTLFWAPLTVDASDERQAIHAEAELAQPLMPGMMAPSFMVLDVMGNEVHFDPVSVEKPLVISFYRGGWCPFCNLHLSEMRHAEQELQELGFEVWFLSIDQPEVLRPSLDQPDIAYTLYSDSSLQATRAFGIAFRVDDETHQRYLSHNIDLEAASGESHHVLPVPSTFIIGKDGRINFSYTNPRYAVRLHPEVLLAAARAYTNDEDARLQRMRKAQREAQKK